MSAPDVIVAHCHPSRGIASGFVITTKTVHHIGHHPAEGWFCLTCSRARKCSQIRELKRILPVGLIEAASEGINRAPVIRVGGRVSLPSGRTGTITHAGENGAYVKLDDVFGAARWFPVSSLAVIADD